MCLSSSINLIGEKLNDAISDSVSPDIFIFHFTHKLIIVERVIFSFIWHNLVRNVLYIRVYLDVALKFKKIFENSECYVLQQSFANGLLD